MKNLAKVGVLCLAIATLVTALHVGAAIGDIKIVSLTIAEGDNTCMLSDYTFTELKASPEDQITEVLTGLISCSFLKNSEEEVTLLMTNLTSDVDTIVPASGFHAQISSGTVLGSIGNLNDKEILSLARQEIIYSKSENTIGSWSGFLTLQGIIPGGTPGGTYTGTLELTMQPYVDNNTGN